MGDGSKRWEDEPSREGLGIIQDILGVPNSALLNKGDMALRLNNQTAQVTAEILEKIKQNPGAMTAMQGSPRDLEQVKMGLAAELQDRFSEMTEALRDQMFQAQEDSLNRLREASQARARQYDIAAGIASQLDDIYDINDYVADGVDQANTHLSSIDSNLDGVNTKLGSIRDNQHEQTGYLRNIQTGQGQQTGVLQRINGELVNNGRNTAKMFQGLAALAIEQAKANEAWHGRVEQALFRGTYTVVQALKVLEFELATRLGGLQNSLGRINRTLQAQTGAIRGVSSDIRSQTRKTVELATTSEEIKARQYREQGRKLLLDGDREEAIKALIISQKLNRLNPETDLLLAEAYAQRTDFEKSEKHLDLAGKRAETPEQLFKYHLGKAGIEKANKQHDAAVPHSVKALKIHPSAFFLYPKGPWMASGGIIQKTITELLTNHDENSEILALCVTALLDMGIQSHMTVKRALLAMFSLPSFHIGTQTEVWKRFHAQIPQILPIIKDLVRQEKQSMNPRALWWVAKILFSSDAEVHTGRELAFWLYKNDPEIRTLVNSGTYRQVADLLKSKLGNTASRILRFGEFPQEIRDNL